MEDRPNYKDANRATLRKSRRTELTLILIECLERAGHGNVLSRFKREKISGEIHYYDKDSGQIVARIYQPKKINKKSDWFWNGKAALRQHVMVYFPKGSIASKITLDHVAFNNPYPRHDQEILPFITEIEDYRKHHVGKIDIRAWRLNLAIKEYKRELTIMRDTERAFKQVHGPGLIAQRHNSPLSAYFTSSEGQGSTCRIRKYKIPGMSAEHQQSAKDFDLSGRLSSERFDNRDGSFTVIQHHAGKRTVTEFNPMSIVVSLKSYDQNGELTKDKDIEEMGETPIKRHHGWQKRRGQWDQIEAQDLRRHFGIQRQIEDSEVNDAFEDPDLEVYRSHSCETEGKTPENADAESEIAVLMV